SFALISLPEASSRLLPYPAPLPSNYAACLPLAKRRQDMKRVLFVVLLAFSGAASAQVFLDWNITLHETVGPHPGAEFSGTLSSGDAFLAPPDGNPSVGMPPGLGLVAIPYGY